MLNEYNKRLIGEGKSQLRTGKSDKLDKQWIYDMICCHSYSSAVLYLGLLVFLIGIIFVAFKLYLTFVMPGRGDKEHHAQGQGIDGHAWNTPKHILQSGQYNNNNNNNNNNQNSYLNNQQYRGDNILGVNNLLQNRTNAEGVRGFRPTVGVGGGGPTLRVVRTIADVLVKKDFVPTTTSRRPTQQHSTQREEKLTKQLKEMAEGRTTKKSEGSHGDRNNNKDGSHDNHNSNKDGNQDVYHPAENSFFTTTPDPDLEPDSTPAPYTNTFTNSYTNTYMGPYAHNVFAYPTQNVNKAGRWQWNGIKWIWKTMQGLQTTRKPPENIFRAPPPPQPPQPPPPQPPQPPPQQPPRQGYYNHGEYYATTIKPPQQPPALQYMPTPVVTTNSYQRWWQQYHGQRPPQPQQPPQPLGSQYIHPSEAMYTASLYNMRSGKYGQQWPYSAVGPYNGNPANGPTLPYGTPHRAINEQDVNSFAEYHKQLQHNLGGFIDKWKNEGWKNHGKNHGGKNHDGFGNNGDSDGDVGLDVGDGGDNGVGDGDGVDNGDVDGDGGDVNNVGNGDVDNAGESNDIGDIDGGNAGGSGETMSGDDQSTHDESRPALSKNKIRPKKHKPKKQWKKHKAKKHRTSKAKTTTTTTTATTPKPTTTTTKPTTTAPTTTTTTVTTTTTTTKRTTTTPRRTTTTEITFSFTNAATQPTYAMPQDDYRNSDNSDKYGEKIFILYG